MEQNQMTKSGVSGFMLKPAAVTRETAEHDKPNAPTPEEIRQQVQHILASPPFHSSKRCQQFLEYVCEQALAGETGMLKERSIAIAVFGRAPESDLGEDTIVRVGAREVRKRLAQYYVTPEGAAAKVRIELPSGTYAPEFHYAPATHEEGHAQAASTSVPAPKQGWRWLIAGLCGAAALLLAAGTASRLSRANPNRTLFQKFWEPILRSHEPLLVAVAHPIVYHPSRRVLEWSVAHQPPQEQPLQRPVEAPPQLGPSDLVPVLNQYVGFGDMVAATEVSQMLAREGKNVRLRLASGIEFADLRQAPAFLIGAVTNRWTMDLQSAWRFRFTRRGIRTVITDSQQPGREWTISSKDDGSSPEDYFLICRIQSPLTGSLTLAAAGLKQFGTEAAGYLLTDPEQLGSLLRKMNPGWESKNLQLVLHARVIGNTPAQPEVVASQVW
jgi:hypothetical protein